MPDAVVGSGVKPLANDSPLAKPPVTAAAEGCKDCASGESCGTFPAGSESEVGRATEDMKLFGNCIAENVTLFAAVAADCTIPAGIAVAEASILKTETGFAGSVAAEVETAVNLAAEVDALNGLVALNAVLTGVKVSCALEKDGI